MSDTSSHKDDDMNGELLIAMEKGDDLAGHNSSEEESVTHPQLIGVSSDSPNVSNDSLSSNFEDEEKYGEIVTKAPVLSAVVERTVNSSNDQRSPPKLQPAVSVPNRKDDDSIKTVFKPLTGSMRNTPASLSIIDVPSSASGKPVRSTRSSIDPSFAAKQRNFLNKVHNALSSARIDDTSSCESDSEAIQDDASDDKSPSYLPGCEDVQVRRLSGPLNSSFKRRREDSSSCKGKLQLVSNQEEIKNVNMTPEKEVIGPSPKKRIIISQDGRDKMSDLFCWFCHREDVEIGCASCVRAYHSRCIRRSPPTDAVGEWVCPECLTILKAENQETRSKALKMLSLDQLCRLLQFAVDRMKYCSGADVFEDAVDDNKFPTYKDYIINPMHLSLLEKNIKRKMYGSTEAFVADASWIVHNCVVFNSSSSKLSSIAKNILRLCKQEMAEIENCPDCYNYAYSEDENWFIQVCRKPHLLVWAKLKGFPYWPAKAMRANADAVDVRFFGQHDRAWVPVRDCFLYCQVNPNPSPSSKPPAPYLQPKKKSPKNNLDSCIEEVELHIKLLQEKFLEFRYAPFKSAVNVKKLDEHLKAMLPQYNSEFTKITDSVEISPIKRPIEGSKLVEQPPKRMKKDSSFQIPTGTMDPASKENDAPVRSVSSTSSSKKETVSVKEKSSSSGGSQVIKKNIIPAFNGNSTPGNKQNCTTSAHNPADGTSLPSVKNPSHEAVSIAEQRLKKKDARKVGLVDRIQEKIASWVARSPSPLADDLDTSVANSEGNGKQKKNLQVDLLRSDVVSKLTEVKDDSRTNEETILHSKDTTKSDMRGEKDCSDSIKKVDGADDVKEDIDAAKNNNPDTKVSVHEKFKGIINTKMHPKVVLEKLDLSSKKKVSSQTATTVKEEVFSSSEDEVDITGRHVDQQAAETFTISEMEFVPDSVHVSQKPLATAKPTGNLAQVSLEAECPPKPVSEPTFKNSVKTECVSLDTSEFSSSFESVSGEAELNESIIPHNNFAEPLAKTPVQPLSTPSMELEQKSAKPANSEKHAKESVQKQTAKSKDDKAEVETNFSHKDNNSPQTGDNNHQPGKLISVNNQNQKPMQSQIPPTPKIRIVRRQFPIRAVKSEQSSQLKTSATVRKPESSQKEEEPSLTISVVKENDSGSGIDSLKSRPQIAIKSIFREKVTPSCSETKDEDIMTNKSTSSASGHESASPAATDAKDGATTVLVQTGGSRKNFQNSPKLSSPPKVLTSPTQRTLPAATSILKINNPTLSDGSISVLSTSSGQTIKVPASKLLTIVGQTAFSKPSSLSSSSSVATPAIKPPSFVTLSQAPNSIPIIRRIHPKKTPLTPVSVPSSASGFMPVLLSPKPQVVSQISVGPLNPAKVSEKPSQISSLKPSITLGHTPVADSSASFSRITQLQVSTSSDLESSFKTSCGRITVGPLYPEVQVSTSGAKEMPKLSIASVCSLFPSSTIQAKSHIPAQTQATSSSQACVSTSSSSISKALLCKGPVSNELKSHASKLTDMFMGCIKDCLSEMGDMGNLEAQIRCLQLDMEHLQWRHKQELDELRHNAELLLSEMRESMKQEVQSAVALALASAAREKEEEIDATKEKQWCAFCKQEAMFYCCWNTSYCDYNCQQNHWPVHSLSCTQSASSDHGQSEKQSKKPSSPEKQPKQ